MRGRLAILLCFAFAPKLFASCGSSSCPIDLHALGLTDTSTLVADLSFQYIKQDHLRGNVPETEHHELQSFNRVATLSLSYRATPALQFVATAPYISREHDHIDLTTGAPEQWRFHDFGDASLQARWRAWRGESPIGSSLWFSAGVKFPTGAEHEVSRGADPEEGEVPIQPGSGSTDILLGATWQSGILRETSLQGMMGKTTLIPLFVSVSYRANGRGTLRYRIGNEVQLNAGSEYPLSDKLHLLGQLNVRRREKDSIGDTSENPDLTGGTFVYLSPGVRFSVSQRTSLYGYVQVPVVQNVNGTQLTSRVNYLVGVQERF
ncbi:MAG TPA: hypothetical protein VF381_00140 [Thermoanaerobaculia bacterium]